MGEKAGGCSRDGGVGNMRWRSAIAGRKGGREDERLSRRTGVSLMRGRDANLKGKIRQLCLLFLRDDRLPMLESWRTDGWCKQSTNDK